MNHYEVYTYDSNGARNIFSDFQSLTEVRKYLNSFGSMLKRAVVYRSTKGECPIAKYSYSVEYSKWYKVAE